MGEKPPNSERAQLSLLFAEYESRVFYWELIETSKKLILTGVLALFLHAGSLMQLSLAIIVAFVVLILQVLIMPYKTLGDNNLSFLKRGDARLRLHRHTDPPGAQGRVRA